MTQNASGASASDDKNVIILQSHEYMKLHENIHKQCIERVLEKINFDRLLQKLNTFMIITIPASIHSRFY